MRDVAIATALGPVAVAGLVAAHRARAHEGPAAPADPPGSHEEAARSGSAARAAAERGGPEASDAAGDGHDLLGAAPGGPAAPGAAGPSSASGAPGRAVPPGHAPGGAAPGSPGGFTPSDPPAPAGGGVHAGRDIRVENQGSGAAVGQAHIVNNYQVTQAAVRLPYRIGRVPALASPFQERDVPELAAADPAGGPPIVLAGMFGTGKSQLAAQYAESAWDRGDLHLLLWADASSREAVLSAYARAGQDLLGRTYVDVADGAQAFLNWLRPAGGTQPHPWLVVLDGVTDPAHLAGLWPPASPGGRVLVTSSRADFEGAGSPRVVRVRPFTFGEVYTYLERALQRNAAARRVAGKGDVEDFVVASARAAVEGGLPPDACLEPRSDVTVSGGDSAQPTPVRRSIEAAAAMAPESVVRAVLALIALLDHDGVLEDVLFVEPARRQMALLGKHWHPDDLTHLGPAGRRAMQGREALTAPVDVGAVRTALRALHVRGVIDREEHGAVRLVRITEGVLRAGLADVPRVDTPEGRYLLRGLRNALAAAWPNAERSLAEARLLWGSVEALEYPDSGDDGGAGLLDGGGIHPLAYRYGHSLGVWGRCAEAERHFRTMAFRAAAAHGADRIGTDLPLLKTLAHAARWRGARGDDFGAAGELAGILARQREALDEEHRDVLTTRHHLAVSQLSATACDAPGPRAELAAVLRGRIRRLGPDHPDTLVTAMAIVRGMLDRGHGEPLAGDDVDAVTDLLITKGHSAGGPPKADPLTIAEALHTELRRVAGEDHPDTVDTLRLLAGMHINLGADDEALALSERALAAAVRVLGPEHPVTLDCRVTAALAAFNSGSDSADEAAFRALADQWEALLGADHPGALGTRAYLLGVSAQDLPPRAPADFADACAELLADTERVFGTDHRRTRQLLAHMADMHESADRPVAALVALADLAARCARVPGPEHPDTLRVRFRVAAARGRQADTVGALTALAELHVDCVRALGAEHPVTLGVRHELALNRYVAGDTPGALSDLARLLQARARLDGPDAESTRKVRDDLERMKAKAEAAD